MDNGLLRTYVYVFVFGILICSSKSLVAIECFSTACLSAMHVVVFVWLLGWASFY